jgi:hypothetical protein
MHAWDDPTHVLGGVSYETNHKGQAFKETLSKYIQSLFM